MSDTAQSPSLKALEGGMIHAIIPFFNEEHDKDAPATYRLRAVESSGLWLESQRLTEFFLEGAERTSSDKTPVVFVPFSEVRALLETLPIPSFSETILESSE